LRELREETTWSAWVEEGSNSASARGSAAASKHERPRDGEGEMEQRDRETGEADWKPRSNQCEGTDAHFRYFCLTKRFTKRCPWTRLLRCLNRPQMFRRKNRHGFRPPLLPRVLF
jgi:hypothetical protein